MKKDEHYGAIPGTDKPTLLKAGAEKLCLTFRLGPDYSTDHLRDGDHLTVEAKCTLYHTPTGRKMGSGLGSCSTKEAKYAWRKGQRLCPKCGRAAIIKGKADYGGGWVCWTKKLGCDAKFKDGDQAIEGQSVDRVPNPDIADQYNTVLKMACKRALVAAVLNVTAASDIFTQDLEDVLPSAEKPKIEEASKQEGPKDFPSREDLISESQAKRLYALATEARWPKDAIKKVLKEQFGYTSSKEIKVKDYLAICKLIETGEIPESDLDPETDAAGNEAFGK